MCDNPVDLQTAAMECIVSNLSKLCTVKEVKLSGSEIKHIVVFRDTSFRCHKYLSGPLLQAIDKRSLLTDTLMTLFTPAVLPLVHVTIRKGELLTLTGLQMLQQHRLESLAIYGLENLNIDDVMTAVGYHYNLKKLCINGNVFSVYDPPKDTNADPGSCYKTNARRSPFPFSKSERYVRRRENASADRKAKLQICDGPLGSCICEFPVLTTLDMSDTDMTSLDLINICHSLRHLVALSLSGCVHIECIKPLEKLKTSLRHLNLHGTVTLYRTESRGTLLALKNLESLDASNSKVDYKARLFYSPSVVLSLLDKAYFVPRIRSIDLSGQMSIKEADLETFLQNHPQIHFMGLMLTNVSGAACILSKPDMKVAGVSTDDQLIECLKRYTKRKEYVPKFLYEIFSMTSTYETPQPQIIQMILTVMNEHPHRLKIQLAATACLYNLTKGYFGENIHPHLLGSVVESTLKAMKNFPTHPQLQKNSLLTLCCDRILHEVTFDKYTCARLVLDALLTHGDASTDRMSVAICSILAANISTSQTAVLGASSAYMKKFLTLVQKKMDEGVVDITLKFTLSALWNLTDESPSTCEVFLNAGGLELFLKLMETFPGVPTVEMKVLGLLNNIAEVSRLRVSLVNRNFITRLSSLLKSDQVEVSYFAAGIIAHLVCAGVECWRNSGIERDDLLVELGDAVLMWTSPDEEMVAYRSFQPFIPLLMALDKPQAQLWAVWALHHVVTKNGERYCRMLVREGVDDVLRRLIGVQNTDRNVVSLARSVVNMLQGSDTPGKSQDTSR